ncbi:hypothetical protein ACLKA7_012329 [Drosophila subpalustris]
MRLYRTSQPGNSIDVHVHVRVHVLAGRDVIYFVPGLKWSLQLPSSSSSSLAICAVLALCTQHNCPLSLVLYPFRCRNAGDCTKLKCLLNAEWPKPQRRPSSWRRAAKANKIVMH